MGTTPGKLKGSDINLDLKLTFIKCVQTKQATELLSQLKEAQMQKEKDKNSSSGLKT